MPSANQVILVVEDAEDDLFLMDVALKGARCENPVHIARDGQEAVDYLSAAGRFADREQFPFPGIIFLDLKLPYRSGLEILSWMRQQMDLPRAFVAVLTGSNQPSDLKRAHELGADTYLVKPPTPEMISDVLMQSSATAG